MQPSKGVSGILNAQTRRSSASISTIGKKIFAVNPDMTKGEKRMIQRTLRDPSAASSGMRKLTVMGLEESGQLSGMYAGHTGRAVQKMTVAAKMGHSSLPETQEELSPSEQKRAEAKEKMNMQRLAASDRRRAEEKIKVTKFGEEERKGATGSIAQIQEAAAKKKRDEERQKLLSQPISDMPID